jgi:hypothetical protein
LWRPINSCFEAYVNVVIVVHEYEHETLMSTFMISEVFVPTMGTCSCFWFRGLHVLRVAFSCAYLSVKKCIKMDISPCSNMQILILKLYLGDICWKHGSDIRGVTKYNYILVSSNIVVANLSRSLFN